MYVYFFFFRQALSRVGENKFARMVFFLAIAELVIVNKEKSEVRIAHVKNYLSQISRIHSYICI